MTGQLTFYGNRSTKINDELDEIKKIVSVLQDFSK